MNKKGMSECDLVYHIVIQDNRVKDKDGNPALYRHAVGLWKSMGTEKRDYALDRVCMDSYATMEKKW